jgi:hypothetical protein
MSVLEKNAPPTTISPLIDIAIIVDMHYVESQQVCQEYGTAMVGYSVFAVR